MQHGLVHRHADGQSRALVHLQVTARGATRKPTRHFHHPAAPSGSVVVPTSRERQEPSSVVIICGISGCQRHVAAVSSVAGAYEKVDVASGAVGSASRVAVDQDRHRRRALHQECARLVDLEPFVGLVVTLPDQDGRRVAVPHLARGIVTSHVAPADRDSGRLPWSDLQPLLGAALSGVQRQCARGVAGDVFRVQTGDLGDAHLLLDHLVLLRADVHALRVCVLIHHAARRDEAAVHGQITKHVCSHRLRPTAADSHKRSAGGCDTDQTLLGGVSCSAVASIHDHVTAGAKLRVSTLKNQRPAVARVAVARPHCHITAIPSDGFAAPDLHAASVAG